MCQENNKLTTSVYRKSTFRGIFTNFKSFIPTVYKFDLVYILLHSCFKIASSYQKIHFERNELKQIFELNGYPIKFIDRCLKCIKMHRCIVLKTSYSKRYKSPATLLTMEIQNDTSFLCVVHTVG